MLTDRFKGKNIIVTGAGSGIGKATAIRISNEGGNVLCADINEKSLNDTVSGIIAAGGKATATTIDQTDAAAVKKLVDHFVMENGHLDVLCNIAGIGGMKKIEDETPEHFQRIMAVNTSGPYYFCMAAIPHLLKSKGNIVNLASTAGLIGQAYTSAYCASKHALIGITKSLALELGRRGIRVNAVCPGSVDTPMIHDFDLPEGIEFDLIGRYGFLPYFCKPEDIASMVAYAASDEAHYVNGAILSVDGGTTAG